MTDSKPSAGETPTGSTPPETQKPHYPRPWWVTIPRFLLLLYGLGTPLFYMWLFARAVIQHTLPTTDRIFFTVPAIATVVLLTAGGIWAIRDMVREWVAADQKRQAERQVPRAVRVEQSSRNDLAKAREQGDRHAEAKALSNIGFWLNAQERYAEAETYLTQSLALARALGDRFQEERDLVMLASCAIARSDLDEAEALHRESLAVALKLSRESMPLPNANDADVLEEVADSYALLGQFLAEERDKRLEGRQMLAEARYREEARFQEMAAQAYRFGSRRRRIERALQRRALESAQEMRDLQRQYGGDDS